jgi:hypothetical protein
LAAEIPKESGYAGPDQPIQPPSSHTATRVHAARSAGVTVSQLDAGAGEVVDGTEGGMVVVVVVVTTERGHDVGHLSRWGDGDETPVIDGARCTTGALRADVIEDDRAEAAGLGDGEPMDVATSAALR